MTIEHQWECIVCYVILVDGNGLKVGEWFDCVNVFSLWLLCPRRLSRLCSQRLQGVCNIRSVAERWCYCVSSQYTDLAAIIYFTHGLVPLFVVVLVRTLFRDSSLDAVKQPLLLALECELCASKDIFHYLYDECGMKVVKYARRTSNDTVLLCEPYHHARKIIVINRQLSLTNLPYFDVFMLLGLLRLWWPIRGN